MVKTRSRAAAYVCDLARTASDMLAIIRAERADLMILVTFAAIIAIVADRSIVAGIKLIRPNLAAALENWQPAIRPLLVGVLCAVALVVLSLRPFWLRAASRRRSQNQTRP